MSHTKSKFSLFPKRSRNEVISKYQSSLEEALSTHGWSISKKQKYTNHFWFIELWVLHSLWSPTDLQLFLVFEDEELSYSAAVAIEEPKEHHSTAWKSRLYLKKGWTKELSNFLASLNAIRDNAISFHE